MKIGIASELLRSHQLYEAIDHVAGSGFDFIEVWMDQYQRSRLSTRNVKKHLRDSGIGWTIHADVRDVNITSINPGIRRESVRQVMRNIEIASALEAPVITIHPGHTSTSKDNPTDYWPILIDVIQKLSDRCEVLGVQMGIENMEPRKGEILVSLKQVRKLFADADRQHLGLTLDLGHLCGQEAIEDYVDHAPHIVNVHLSDFTKGKGHAALGKGEYNWAAIFDRLRRRYDGTVVIEGYTPGCEDQILAYLWVVWKDYMSKRAT